MRHDRLHYGYVQVQVLSHEPLLNLGLREVASAHPAELPLYNLTYCPGYRGAHFMDIAGEVAAPDRKHLLTAATAGGLPVTNTA